MVVFEVVNRCLGPAHFFSCSLYSSSYTELVHTISFPVAWGGGLDDGIFRGVLAPGYLAEGAGGAGVRWARIHAISALSTGRSLTYAIVSARLPLGTTGSGLAAMRGCGGGVVGGSAAGLIGGAGVGARMGGEVTQSAWAIGRLPANLEHGTASARPSFALVFEGKLSFSLFLFPPTWY